MFDILIKGGLVVDGAGAPGYHADVAIKDGLIAEIGRIEGPAKRSIDAGGLVVSPGFIDLHTHFDAQVVWDPDLTPVCWHGVTTALMGNCGLSMAPCKPADRPVLAKFMEAVEEIPSEVILSNLPWTWDDDYGDYLSVVDRLGLGVNIIGMVGHSAVRYHVMGERSFAEQATPGEIEEMTGHVRRALDAGALGFSTNRFELHRAPDGRPIPGTYADSAELVEIGKMLASRGALMQVVGASPDFVADIADRTGARMLFISGAGVEKGAGNARGERLTQICQTRDMTAICQIRPTGGMFGLQSSLPFYGGAWDRLRGMTSLNERLRAIQDPSMAAALEAEGKPAWGSIFQTKILFYLGDDEMPNYTAPAEDNVEKMMSEAGETFVQLFIRLSRETEGRALFNLRWQSPNLDDTADFIRSPYVFPGLGDAGAHGTSVMDAGWASFILSYWVRQRGHYSLEEGVRRMTSGPAKVLGLADRGVLAVGKRADVNVFDADEVAELQPRIVYDVPGGAPRFVQRAKGYKATIVNGEVNVLEGALTGVRAGRLLRRERVAGPDVTAPRR